MTKEEKEKTVKRKVRAKPKKKKNTKQVKNKRKLGRKSKLTEEKMKDIVRDIRNGNYATIACIANGIDESTYYRWQRAGQEALTEIEDDIEDLKEQKKLTPEEIEEYYYSKIDKLKKHNIFYLFYQRIKRAEAEAQKNAVEVITAASYQNWQAAAFKLERKHPKEWGRKIENTVKEYPQKVTAVYIERDDVVEIKKADGDVDNHEVVDL